MWWSATIIRAGGFVLLRCVGLSRARRKSRERKKALNTVFDCDTAALTSQPPDQFAKCVSIKHDLAAHQLSLQDCIVSAGGVGHVCQLLLILPANGGRDVKACLHRQIIPPRKHAFCGVEGHSFHKQRPPGCRRHTSASAASEQLSVSAFSRRRCFFSAGGDGWRFSDLQLLSRGADLCLSHTPDVLEPAGPMINSEAALERRRFTTRRFGWC